jgi:hypothetical protein
VTTRVGASTGEMRTPTDARRVLFDVAWWVVAVALVVANLAVIVPGIASVRLWEDEAFNLSVPLNLARGLGYTSDGTLSGSELAPFDVRISTGPVMLLPIAGLIAMGVDPVFAGRAIAWRSRSWAAGSAVGGRRWPRWRCRSRSRRRRCPRPSRRPSTCSAR